MEHLSIVLEGPTTEGEESPAPAEPPPADKFARYEIEPAWRDYPCEWRRPRFAHIPHEVDWHKLLELRRQRAQMASADPRSGANKNGDASDGAPNS
jgi:hypothetical protein